MSSSRTLYLVSRSPRRRMLMTRLGYTFEVVPPRWEEPRVEEVLPEYVLSTAWRKLESVLPHVRDATGVFLAADTVVWQEGKILGKPRDLEEARHWLRLLSGVSHWVFTGLAVYDRASGKRYQVLVKTKVRFKKLTPQEMDWILHMDDPLDKAGGYAFQGVAGLFVESIEGNFYNIIGLPIPHVVELLRRVGIQPDLDQAF